MSLLMKAGGITKLSELGIDTDKDWNKKSIINVAELLIGDIVFKNQWRLMEVEDGIVLVDNKGETIRRWTNAQTKGKRK